MDKEIIQFKDLMDLFKDYEEQQFFEKMGKIVLYDQVSENIFSNTSDAYVCDHISIYIALKLFDILDYLSIQYR